MQFCTRSSKACSSLVFVYCPEARTDGSVYAPFLHAPFVAMAFPCIPVSISDRSSLKLCLYLCIYVYIHMFILKFICTYIYICRGICIYLPSDLYAYIHTYIHASLSLSLLLFRSGDLDFLSAFYRHVACPRMRQMPGRNRRGVLPLGMLRPETTESERQFRV